jgi:hypothetical protein
MVWRAAKVGSNRIQFVTTHYYLPDAQGEGVNITNTVTITCMRG